MSDATPYDIDDKAIAVIGMAGRFPGARDLDAFWQNLREGVESVVFFSDEELRAAGVAPRLLARPNYVKAGMLLDEIERFDAAFFGFSHTEAEIMDPQQRVFLECAWESLEHAGYTPANFDGMIGVYAGAALNTYLLNNLLTNRDQMAPDGDLHVFLHNDKDYMPTRVSYKLNLKGPSVSIQSACSTSLVAIHVACLSLLHYECDMALAGGVTVLVPQQSGYLSLEGGVDSPDGHCRAFDAEAAGTVFGSGIGVVVLKRLADAIEAGDTIHAVIIGSAINNDGAVKMSYAAPSVDGQAEVIDAALAVAGVAADTISYIEAHGTGTELGDPIEIAALTKVFRTSTNKTGFCAIGSVKSNIGHLATAAGVAGFIKTVLALKHRQIPPSLNCDQPNPRIDFSASPFYVNTALTDWKAGDGPRRAGVNSFGIGGTNAHIILEEPPAAARSEASRPWQLLVLSAKTPKALETATDNLARFLAHAPMLDLADVAYTLQVGRAAFRYRRILACQGLDNAIHALQTRAPQLIFTEAGTQEPRQRPIVFAFPGQGTQYVRMALDLYQHEPVFRAHVDQCAGLLRPHLGIDLREVIFDERAATNDEGAATIDAGRWTIDDAPPSSIVYCPSSEPGDRINQTQYAQPALFVIEYALARLWMVWGVQPQAMIGHSIGEYVAACLAGVFSLEDALALVAARGRMMQALPGGAMLAVPLPEDELRPLLEPPLSLAAMNGPALCVIAGPAEAVGELHARLAAREIECRALRTSHAFHSPAMDAIVAPFTNLVGTIRLHPPQLPFVSNVSGAWITAAEATDPRYWARQLREPVRFAAGLQMLFQMSRAIILEVGPGKTLSGFCRQHPARADDQLVLPSMRPPSEQQDDLAQLLTTLGRLWLAGVRVDWEGFTGEERRRRVPLPTYPFERQRYWIAPSRATANQPADERGAQKSASSRLFSHEESAVATSQDPQPAARMPDQPATIEHPSASGRRAAILLALTAGFSRLLGVGAEEIDAHATFFEMGADSLAFIQVSQAIQDEYGVKVSFRQLLGEFTTIAALAAYIDQELPPEPPLAETAPAAVSRDEPPQSPGLAQHPVRSPADGSVERAKGAAEFPEAGSTLERILAQQLELQAQQLQIQAQQLELLRGALGSEARLAAPAHEIRPAAPPAAPPAPTSGASEPFRPYQPVRTEAGAALSERQQRHLDALIARYTSRTRQSKQLTQTYRSVLADNRASAGFRFSIKEMLYPIVGERARGARIWDVDGNEYIDLTMGFGVNLFGHSEPFIMESIEEQLKLGIQLGPQSRLAGEVAALICELTGQERAAFCNSGTETVMTALRLARTVTGRSKIVLFAGAYHGHFDGVLARAQMRDGNGQGVPMAPGVPAHLADDVIVLDYDSAESLDTLRAHGQSLAAILVEPVQSRRPEIQPRAFLQQLRQLATETGAVLIFDEMITGFRIHPGGVQSFFDLRADLTTYGKIIGGGLPIGVVAGKARFLDAIDGGLWTYGDASYPQAETTIFAGTFCKHPLAMATARAVLMRLKVEGPALQAGLNRRTERLASTLNAYFETTGVPIHIVYFGSLFRFAFTGNMDLLFYHLHEKGIYIWEGRNCFLSTAHTDEDVDYVVQAVRDSVEELREGGFLPGPVSSVTNMPLTDAQKELWILAQIDRGASSAYNEFVTLRAVGALDLVALSGAVGLVIKRHEALRTTFSPDGSYQHITSAVEVEIPLIDLSRLEQRAREAAALAWLEQTVHCPFDLAYGPLIRLHVLRLEAQEHVLLLVVHHIVVDGWSIGVLLREMSILYSAACAGVSARLPAPLQFREYVQWQARQSDDSKLAAAEAYWLGQFAQPVPALELPTDRPRPPLKTYAGAREHALIDADLVRAIKRLNARYGYTLFMTLLTGFEVLLHRLSGQDDLVVGIPATGQPFVEGGEALVGYCINMLPLRSRLDGDRAFLEQLDLVKQQLLDANDHHEYPFSRLLRKLNRPRDLSRSPLVTVMFNLDRALTDLTFAGLDYELVTTPIGAAKFDLFLNIVEVAGNLRLDCDYSSDLFDAQTIRRWLGHFQTLLERLIGDPAQGCASAALLSPAERQQLLVEWNDTSSDYPGDRCIHQLFEAQVVRSPSAIAVASEDQHLSYQELNRRANRLAHRLRALGIGPEVIVGVGVERSLELIIALLGVLKAGGAYVPLDPTYPPERLAFMLADAQAQVLISSKDDGRWTTDEATQPESLHDLGLTINTLRASSAAIVHRTSEIVHPDNLAYVIYTSGSTGRSKGVQISHRALVNVLDAMRRQTRLAEADALLALTTLSFDIAALELYLPLIVGARLEIGSHELLLDGMRLVARQEEARATVMQATPATWRLLLKVGWAPRRPLKILCGGETLPQELALQLLERAEALWNLYGPTETTVWSASQRVDSWTTPVPIGRPIANTQIYLLDRRLHPTLIGVPGELYIGGDGLARGYLNRPDLTAERLVPNPFLATNDERRTTNDEAEARPGVLRPSSVVRLYKTGDLARYRPDGSIEFLGRLDQQVKLRGFRIELGEIEAALSQYPGVGECVVVLRDSNPDDRRLVAYVVTTKDDRQTTNDEEHDPSVVRRPSSVGTELRAFLREKLPEYMVPSAFVLLDALPLTPNGKIARAALPAVVSPERATTYIPPETGAEQTIAAIWQEVLALEKIGIYDNFFELGGHSLLIAEVLIQLNQVFNRSIPIVELFEYPTISALAKHLSNGADRQPVIFEKEPEQIEARSGSLRRRRETRQAFQVVIDQKEHGDG
jgi:amino acid adenylation domain-containing protein